MKKKCNLDKSQNHNYYCCLSLNSQTKKGKLTIPLFIKIRLDVELPPSPMAAHWILNMAYTCHLSDELWHWTILLDLFSQNSLHSEGFVRCHKKGRPKPFESCWGKRNIFY